MNRRSLFKTLFAIPAAAKLAPEIKAATPATLPPVSVPSNPIVIYTGCTGYTGYVDFTGGPTVGDLMWYKDASSGEPIAWKCVESGPGVNARWEPLHSQKQS